MASARVRAAFERHVAALGDAAYAPDAAHGPDAAHAPDAARAPHVARERDATPRAPLITLLDGQAQRALAAADAAIVASGTATLETLLTGRPMVVAYRLSAVTAFLLRRLALVKVPYFSQPNLLVGRRLVPEFFQEQVSGAALGAALLQEIDNPEHVSELGREFRRVHEALRRGGAERAAAAILECVRGVPDAASAQREAL
ncbi:MAG: hypothetical protein JO042_10335 [Sinobacteraceae bacterium]|nr:hypothetical protein [Nevskiaceae bacterium]